MLELNQISDGEKITNNFHFVRRPRAALCASLTPFHPCCTKSLGIAGRPFCSSSARRRPLHPPGLVCLSFELYPLNLQLWGAASMRDTFSRKFARRILKPRGKQDQYLASREEGTRWSWMISRVSFGWSTGRFAFLPSFLPARRVVKTRWDNTQPS